MRWLDDLAAGAVGLGQHRMDALFGADDVGERDTAKAAAVGDAGVVGEHLPWVERQLGGAVGTAEGNEVALVHLDGQPSPWRWNCLARFRSLTRA